jgi:hypothetical protein
MVLFFADSLDLIPILLTGQAKVPLYKSIDDFYESLDMTSELNIDEFTNSVTG